MNQRYSKPGPKNRYWHDNHGIADKAMSIGAALPKPDIGQLPNLARLKKRLAVREKPAPKNYTVTLGTSVKTYRRLKADLSSLSIYIVGQTGGGKSNLMSDLFLQGQDLPYGRLLIDPMGKMTNSLILPNLRHPERVIYLAPHEQAMQGFAIAWNPLDLGRVPNSYERDALAGSIRQVFEDLWFSKYDVYAPRARLTIQAALHTLLRFEAPTLIDFYRLLADRKFRSQLINQIDDLELILFWREVYRRDWGDAVLNKIDEFLKLRVIRNIVSQKRSAFYLSEALSQGKFIICNLAGLQEASANLLGALLISRIVNELKRREPLADDQISPVACFIDEADKMGTTNLDVLLSKARQNKIATVLAHQHHAQLDAYPVLKSGVFMAGTVISFQTDHRTAKEVQGEFGPDVDLTRTPRHHAWIRQNKGRTGSTPTVELILTRKVKPGNPARAEEIKQRTRFLGCEIEKIEAEINQSHSEARFLLKAVSATEAKQEVKNQSDLSRLPPTGQEGMNDTPTPISTPRDKDHAGTGPDRPTWTHHSVSLVFRHL